MKKVFALALLLVVCSFATSLAAPAPPEMTLSTNTLEVTVSWSPVDDATGYHLYYAPYPFTGPETIGSLEMGNETSFSIELWEGAAYYIAVKAYNDDGESDYSNIDAFIINANGMFTYSALPTLNETATLTFDSEEDLGGIEWRVVSEPHGSELALQVAADNRSVAFTPQQVGGYEIVVRSTAVNFRQVTSFTIAQPFSYDEGQIDGNDGTVDLSEIIGAIKNQSWVYSDTLTESQIRAIVSLFSDLAIMGYDPIQGLLIEYDEEGVQLTGSLAALKNEAGITSVINRVYEGEDAFETNLIPDDGSSFFDGGNNWHLEFIDAPLAWDITTGNSEIVVGVVDAGFDITHSELSGRVSELLTDSKDLHGNGCAGAIGALTDNGQGISGVNWISQMSLSLWGYSNTASMVAKTNVPVSSHSWTNVAAPNDFDLTDTTAVEEQDALSLLRTRSYRKLALSYPEKMMVRSAGNGVGNGRGYAGVYGMDARHGMAAMHYDDNGALDKLNNVLFVAAMNNADHLVHYSNYGEAVDIAAPTHFTSIGVDQSLIGFSGTSASTPVVSGVASLIYSLNPDFTAQQVKDILINSATQYVSKRYVKPSSSDEETLAHPLPILNAANALDMAYEIINGNRLRLTDLVISGGALALEGEPLQLTATAYWSDGSSRDVSADAVWREDSPAIVSVNGGLVNAGQVSLDTPVLVSASFLFEDQTLDSVYEVTVKNSQTSDDPLAPFLGSIWRLSVDNNAGYTGEFNVTFDDVIRTTSGTWPRRVSCVATDFGTRNIDQHCEVLTLSATASPNTVRLYIFNQDGAGTYYFYAIEDVSRSHYYHDQYDGNTLVSSESGNYTLEEITDTVGADLVVSSGAPAVSPVTVYPGDTVNVPSITVRNQGASATGNFSSGLYFSTDPLITAHDTRLSALSTVSLPEGGQTSWGATTLDIPANATAGTYYIGVLVDENNDVVESNEGNNYVATQITILTPVPDLTIITGTPTVTPHPLYQLDFFDLSAYTIKNQGSAPISGGFSIGFYWSDDPVITTADTLMMQGNTSTQITHSLPVPAGGQINLPEKRLYVPRPLGMPMPPTTSPGTYYVGILVDDNNEVSESDETNNYVVAQVTVLEALPDYVITSGAPTLTPAIVPAGGTFNVSSITVKNQGHIFTSVPHLSFYLSPDPVITSADTRLPLSWNISMAYPLDAGRTDIFEEQYLDPLTIPVGTAPGNYYLGVLLDHTNGVAEENEDNNYVSTPITVVAP